MFLDTEIYLYNVKLHKVIQKETDRKYYRHIKSEHPKSLKHSLPYSQAIRIKRKGSNQVDLNKSLKEMKNNFVKQGYYSPLINEQLERISLKLNLLRKKTPGKN